ncbi:MAG: hypothetical protein E7317_04475 [Clostridiales bacterium]|nr:hypothetical protein [Clostridiales bacterium]
MDIALLGLGHVGGDVHKLLAIHPEFRVKRILARRPRPELGALFTRDMADIANDDTIEAVVEALDGVEPARTYVLDALRHGKHVVTANCRMAAFALEELVRAANDSAVSVRFNATVGCSIPWLIHLAAAARVDPINVISGIPDPLSTSIIDDMTARGCTFDASLAELGASVKHPEYTLAGLEARDTLAISASIAFRKYLHPQSIDTFGLANLQPCDTETIGRRHMTLRLALQARRTQAGGIAAWVEPTIFQNDTVEANTKGGSALFICEGKGLGRHMLAYTQKGKDMTAAGIVSSLYDLRRNAMFLTGDSIEGRLDVNNHTERHSYYVRSSTRIGLPARALRTRNGVHYCITEPVSVAHMHALAAAHLLRDPQAFIAGFYSDYQM